MTMDGYSTMTAESSINTCA